MVRCINGMESFNKSFKIISNFFKPYSFDRMSIFRIDI